MTIDTGSQSPIGVKAKASDDRAEIDPMDQPRYEHSYTILVWHVIGEMFMKEQQYACCPT